MRRTQFKLFFLTFLVVVGLTSCTNLEIEETDSIISEGFQGLADPSSTVDEILNRMNGHYGAQENKYALDEVTTDAFLIPTRGTDWGDNGRWRSFHQHEWNEETADIIRSFDAWNGNQLLASQVLDDRSNPSQTDIGEASFLRAYSMFIILDLFGQVPFRDVTLPSSALPEVLTAQAAVDFIIADLDRAISNLASLPPGSGEAATFRPSKEAAQFLKAKVLLNKFVFIGGTADSGDMQSVISLVDDIAAAGYQIETIPYFDIFKIDADNETLWSLKSNINWRCNNTLHYNMTSASAGGGWNGFSTLAEYYDLFEGDPNSNRVETDLTPLDGQEPRRGGVPSEGLPFTGRPGTTDDGGFEDASDIGFGFLIGQQYNLDGTPVLDRPGAPLQFTRDFVDGSGASNLINNNEQTGIRVIKYNPRFGGTVQHQIIMRYADAHLMKAEALWRNGGDPTSLVNELRVIRGANPLGSVGAQEIIDERGRELYGEAWRRQDLKRFGLFLRAWEFKPSQEVGNETRNLFPIPAQQLLANPNLVQNPGY